MIKNIYNQVNTIIKNSFQKAWKGEEKLNNIFYWWGGIAYLACYFITRPLIHKSPYIILDALISLIIVAYFTLHIVLIKRNSPKKPALSKEEKKKLKEEAKKERTKRVIRKLLLKEPLTKWRPALVFGAIDLFIITTYIGYIL